MKLCLPLRHGTFPIFNSLLHFNMIDIQEYVVPKLRLSPLWDYIEFAARQRLCTGQDLVTAMQLSHQSLSLAPREREG